MSRRRRAWAWGCATLMLLDGCGRRHPSPTAPAPPPPPGIEQVYPPARSMGVPDDTEIWAQFAVALDPATVNEHNVRLRVDTIRIPASVSWEPDTRRIRIRPSGPLMVNRTHTVELRAELTTADKRALGRAYQWQFTTFSVRRPGTPFPPEGTLDESPFVTLSWDGTDSGAGTIAYELFFGRDSAQVAARGLRAVTLDRAYYVPRARWPSDSTTYWSVTTINRSTADSLEGPVWRFHPLPPDAPIQTIVVPISDWGYYDGFTGENHCFESSFTSGGGRYNAAVRWKTGTLGPRKLASATIRLQPASPVPASARPTLWYATGYWSACSMGAPGPPFTEPSGQLTTTTPLGTGIFSTDYLTAHIEASLRRPGFYGYVVKTNTRVDYFGSSASMTLDVYREPAGARVRPGVETMSAGLGGVRPVTSSGVLDSRRPRLDQARHPGTQRKPSCTPRARLR